MPFIPNTPESLLARSDSKNPSKTCQGLTAAGRPCRRAISPAAAATASSQRPHHTHHTPNLFCWQHKEQAATAAQPSLIQRSTIRERSSVDTLVDRLGLLDVRDGKAIVKDTTRKDALDRRRGTHMKEKEALQLELGHAKRQPKPKSKGLLSLLCGSGSVESKSISPKAIKITSQPASSSTTSMSQMHPRISVPSRPRPPFPRDPSSRDLLRLIPRSLPPQTTSALLAELAKPISDFDEEGYIYMFWLTQGSSSLTPPTDTAARLLETSPRPGAGRRKTSDVLQEFASEHSVNDQAGMAGNKAILLKIGRASNVQRRLNEWKRQCGYHLSLIRYYPYQASQAPGATKQSEPRKVPNAHKVERLIHIELAGRRAGHGGGCEACGREHREWFEVDASRDGVKAVDEIIKRWVDWGFRTNLS